MVQLNEPYLISFAGLKLEIVLKSYESVNQSMRILMGRRKMLPISKISKDEPQLTRSNITILFISFYTIDQHMFTSGFDYVIKVVLM